MPPSTTPSPFSRLFDNLQDAEQLQKIHTSMTGTARGRRFDIDVLNRSGIVLVVAAWESFVEDTAEEAFDFLINNAAGPQAFPSKVLSIASAPLRQDPDERKVWDLAGSGWKNVLQTHRANVIREFLGGFHNPRPDKVDALYERLLGLANISGKWKWRQNASAKVVTKLNDLINLRGKIAHRLTPERYVTKDEVSFGRELVGRIAAVTQNRVAEFVETQVGARPWVAVSYGSAE